MNDFKKGAWVTVDSGSKVITEKRGKEKIEILDEEFKGRIIGFLFGNVIVKSIDGKQITASLRNMELAK